MKKLLLLSMALLLCVPFLAGCDDDDNNKSLSPPPTYEQIQHNAKCREQGKESGCILDPLPSEPATPPPVPTEH